VHLIPRRQGDIENPRGGVRGVIPAKQKYIKKEHLEK
jgi:diadenosine tetraphosphate (Ap4A) HIT family hydrolase